MSLDAGPQLIDGEHVVQLYADEDELLSMVAGYLSSALAVRDTVIVIATAGHREAFEAALTDTDVRQAQQDGLLVILDAAATLSKFMVDGLPDAHAFDEVVGKLVRAATASGTPVRAYGEMVALLWDDGLVEGAIELERLWNDLCEVTPFALFCAYPLHVTLEPRGDAMALLCQLHSRVLTSAPKSECETTRRFPRMPGSSRQARRFVADTLETWDQLNVVEDALIAVAELAANAITHAESDFTVGLSRIADGVHVEVSDSSHAIPKPQPGCPTAPGGRGLILLEKIGRRWGHHLLDGGKVVWVDLADSETA